MKLNRENIEAIYPLLPNQEAFWLAQQYAEQDPGCLQATYRLKGSLDRPVFEQALEFVFAQHAMLRATVQPRPEKSPLLVVSKEGRPSLEFHDLRNAGGDGQRSIIESIKQAELDQGIDLSSLPPCRFHLFRTDEDHYELLWTFHHLFVDGWSTSVAVRDLLLQYERMLKGLPPKVSLAKVSDFVSWRKTNDEESERDFWSQQLGGYRGLPKLSGIPNQFGWNRQKLETSIRHLQRESSAALTELSKTQNVTPASIAAGIWAMSVSQLYDRQDVAFGVTVSGRSTPLDHAQEMVGLFANVVPMRRQFSGSETIKEVLRSVRDQQFQIQEFEHTPLGEISTNRKLDRGNALFESLLVIENYPSFQTDGSLELLGFESGLSTAYPLTVCVIPSRDWSVKVVFEPQVVEAELAEAIVADFVDRLAKLPEVLERPLQDFRSDLSVSLLQPPLEGSAVRCVVKESSNASEEVPSSIGNPRNETELELAMIWEKILGITEVRYDDNFFAIGGNSLTAARLMVAIESSFGKSLSPSVLIENPTVESLALILKSDSAQGSSGVVVRFNRQRSGRPLIFVHVGSEAVMFYRHLAGYFEDRPVFGTQSRGLIRGKKTYSTVEEAASDFIAEIDRLLLANGISCGEPWDLVAYCAGTGVAFEMARQLESSNRKTGCFVIIDSPIKFRRNVPTLSYFKELEPKLTAWLPRYLRHLYNTNVRRPIGLTARPILARIVPDESARQRFLKRHVQDCTMKAYFSYQFEEIKALMMLVRSSEYAADRKLDYQLEAKKHSVDQQLRVEIIDDSKHGTILLEPTVATVAHWVRKFSTECTIASTD